MIAVPDSPRLRTVLALRRLNSVLSMTNRAVGAVLGIKDADLTVLDVLHREGPLTPTELARRTRTHLATMTGVLRRLEREDGSSAGPMRRTGARCASTPRG